MKTKLIMLNFFNFLLKIERKFSALPTLPTKIDRWSIGYDINFRITLANLID